MVRNGQNHQHRIAAIKKTSASHRYQKLTTVEVYTEVTSVTVWLSQILTRMLALPPLQVEWGWTRIMKYYLTFIFPVYVRPVIWSGYHWLRQELLTLVCASKDLCWQQHFAFFHSALGTVALDCYYRLSINAPGRSSTQLTQLNTLHTSYTTELSQHNLM